MKWIDSELEFKCMYLSFKNLEIFNAGGVSGVEGTGPRKVNDEWKNEKAAERTLKYEKMIGVKLIFSDRQELCREHRLRLGITGGELLSRISF